MTQPFDPLNPPNLGLGLRQGMFSTALQCPTCGFATSDDQLYECPFCGMVWRQRPAEPEKQDGRPVELACILCGQDFSDGRTVVTSGRGLAHQDCHEIGPTATTEPSAGYLEVVASAPKRKRRRKRKRKPANTEPITSMPVDRHEAEALEEVLETLE